VTHFIGQVAMAQLPRVDGFLRERLPDGQIAYARLHAPPLQTLPSPFELVPISPLLTREELERDYLPGGQDEPEVRLMVPMERIRELLALTNGGPRFALNIYFYFFQRYFWAARDRVRVRRADAPLRPCAPVRLAVVYDDDYAFDEGAHPDTSVLDLMWQQMQRHQFFGLPEAAVRQFLFNLVRCSVVMLGSRGFKGVEVQGQLEAHNDAVRQHQDGRLYTREFRVLTARTRADSIMRPRVLPVGPVPKTITRRCPSYYTHTWWQHEPLWRPQPVPPLTQTQAHWRKLYQFACDLAPFLGTSDRTTLARALDRQCPRGTPFHGSLNRSAKVFDPELFPQTQARVGGLERLRLCHFVADGGLAVCPPLHALLEDDACDADDSELWNPPLPTLRARAAAASASAVDDEPASHRTRVAAPAIAASAATGARATDPLHAVKQRVMFDLELGHGLSREPNRLVSLLLSTSGNELHFTFSIKN
jgi:hypothetical protein